MSEKIKITDEDLDILYQNNDSNNQSSDEEMEETVRYQPNINQRYRNAGETVELTSSCLPLLFHHHYDDVTFLEKSNKLIIPKNILYELSPYDNLIYPLHFKINNKNILFSVYEFSEDVDQVFIPQEHFKRLDIEYNEPVSLRLINKEIVKGKKIKIQPHTKNFLDLENPKEYLEEHLTKLYSCLSVNQTFSLPYFDISLYFNVLECNPEETISLIDTDIEVDFDKPLDYIEPPKPLPKPKPQQNNYSAGNLNFQKNNESNKNNESSKNNQGFVAFSGTGHRLGGD